MGIKGKFSIVTIIIGIIICFASYTILDRSNDKLIEMEATRIADIVSTQILSDRAIYTKTLVGKLKNDGLGAARDWHQKKGFIALPAQFVRAVAQHVDSQAEGLYSYKLKSQWNLNTDQGLVDSFDKWSWAQLMSQDKTHNYSSSNEPQEWDPVYRFETVDGKQVLHYVKADPASASACVSCHNAYENREDVKMIRVSDGVEPGKQWELHQLMGAIRVNIPVSQVAAAAEAGQNRMLYSLGTIFAIGFIVLFFLIFNVVIKPIEESVQAVEGFSQQIDDVVKCSRELLIGADEQLDACNELKEKQDSDKRKAEFEELANLADKSAMRAEESSMYCSDLETQFSSLRAKLNRILGN